MFAIIYRKHSLIYSIPSPVSQCLYLDGDNTSFDDWCRNLLVLVQTRWRYFKYFEIIKLVCVLY